MTGPLKLYAGYEWINSRPRTTRRLRLRTSRGFSMGAGFADGTAINNVAYSAGCRGPHGLQRQDPAGRVDRRKIYDHSQPGCDRCPYITTAKAHSPKTRSCASLGSHSNARASLTPPSAVLDWQFANKFDAYIGFMFSQVNGGLSNSYLARNDLIRPRACASSSRSSDAQAAIAAILEMAVQREARGFFTLTQVDTVADAAYAKFSPAQRRLTN